MMNLDYDSSVMFIKDRQGHDFRYSISNVKISNIDINLQTDFEKNLKHTIKCLLEAK